MGKVFTVFISSILTSLLMSYYDYVPEQYRQEGSYYYSYDHLFLHGILSVLPIYLFLGIPASLLTDFLLRKKVHSKHGITRYIAWLGGYLVAGCVVATILLFILNNNISYPQGIYNLYATLLLGSFIFFHVAMIVEPLVLSIKKRIFKQINN